MKGLLVGFGLLGTLASAPRLVADAGIVTILEGPARVLRGPTWYRLALGGRVQDGDLVDLSGRAQVQVETGGGLLVNLSGPASLYLASIPSGTGGSARPADLYVAGGWLKVAARGQPGGLRLHTALGAIALTDAIVVLEATPGSDVLFLESGTAQLIEAQRGGGPSRDAKAGEFWSHAAGRPFALAPRPPPAFLEKMPRHFMDPLPTRAAKLRDTRAELAPDRDVLYGEVKTWLAGPYRKAFLQGLRPRLADAAFRGAVEPDLRSYPEWDHVLHPERYLPKKETEKP